jgi:uncharacterized membrane protein required for colicin V production
MDIPPLSTVDVVALILIAIGGIQGFFRGLSGEIARLVGVVLAFVAGLSLHGTVGEWMAANTKLSDQSAHSLAFIATIILAIIIMILLRIVLKNIVKLVFAEGFDKGAGIIAGLLRMSVIVCTIFVIMNLIPHDYLNRVFGEESIIGQVVRQYVPTIKDTLAKANIHIPKAKSDELGAANKKETGDKL